MEDLFGGTQGLHWEEEILAAVEIDEWSDGVVVGGQADLDGFGAIVFALEKWGVAMVADIIDFWRLVGDVEDGFALGARAASTEAGDDFG